MTVKAIGPGEISGPGLAITVTIANGTAAAIDLNNTIVDLTGSDGAPTVPITSADKPITGVLAPGKSATGTYQFKIPEALRDPVTIAVSYSTSAAVVVFNGSAR